jgi:GNAT superfamily N-acetyltransferase
MHIAPAEVETILPLRHAVLRAGMPVDAARFQGDHDPSTLHLAGWLDGEVTACLTVHRQPYHERPAWRLRGMAVAGAQQGRGLGSALLRDLHARLDSGDGPHLIWCNAREIAVRFYQRHGYAIASARFDIPTAGPHYVMVREP